MQKPWRPKIKLFRFYNLRNFPANLNTLRKMAIKTLTATRYANGNTVASVASADAAQVAFDDTKILWGSLQARTEFGSQFLYQAFPNKTVRTQVLQTPTQVRASFSVV